MIKRYYFLEIVCLTLAILFQSCEKKTEQHNTPVSNHKNDTNDQINNTLENNIDNNLKGTLPDWLFEEKIILNSKINTKYEIDLRLNPNYLSEDFNGDTFKDIAIPIKETQTGKLGFAIIHGNTKEIYIVGAGKMIKNALDDDLNYIDNWTINQEKEVTGFYEDENGELLETDPISLKSPSISIEMTELGGGLIFWNGTAYEYLHQTC